MSDLKESMLDRIKRIKSYLDNRSLAYVLLCLRSKDTMKYIHKFIDTKKSDMKDTMLDIIEVIIIGAKTVYESDTYNDPYADELYDEMLSKFKKFRPEPFGDNGMGLANAKYKYDVLSGTLDKVHFIHNSERTKHDERGSLEDYIKRIPSDKKIRLLVNQKKDGTSVTIDYKLVDKKYVPQSAISRGKKDYGEGTDVSAVIPDCSFDSEPLYRAFGFLPKYIGVQYELLVSNRQKREFEEYSGQEFANNRSAASGLLRRIVFANRTEQKILKKFVSLSPVGFDVLDEYIDDKSYRDNYWDTKYEAVYKTFSYGDVDMEWTVFEAHNDEILSKFEKIAFEAIKERKELNHAIDGLVMTICDPLLQNKMGRKNNINQFQIAYKFPEESYKTHIRDVEITTGNFGYKELLLIVDPVVLNGTKQFKAQVHSIDRFKKLDLRIGDEIILKLSGDVIPYGYKDDTCESGTGTRIKLPTHCDCGAKLVEEKNRLRCSDPKCPYRETGSLVTFFKELNAKGIGPKICAQLYKDLHIRKPSQILKLKFEDIRKLDGFKDDGTMAVMNTIKDIVEKPRTLSSILSALGIDCLRASTASKMLDTIDIDEIIHIADNKDYNRLASRIRESKGIDENASGIAEGIIDNIDELKELLTIIPVKKSFDKSKLDKSILISGMRNDEELISVANQAGFDVKDSGTKYDILVIKDESMMSASKAQFALSHNRPIMTRKEFINKFR